MNMSPRMIKALLMAHVTSSLGWLGALSAFLVLSVASLSTAHPETTRAATVAMALVAWYAIFPLSLATLLTGVTQALVTRWGLFRHYWVVAKLLLAVLATTILILKLAPIGVLADAAAEAGFAPDAFTGLRNSILLHAVGGLLVLLATTWLAIFKPAGMTPLGIRRQGTGADQRVPRWVKVFGAFVLVLILMTLFMLLAGGHGPGAHVS